MKKGANVKEIFMKNEGPMDGFPPLPDPNNNNQAI
jgi:hypothetical protein